MAGRASTLPNHLQPTLTTLTDAPFDDKGWIFEDKYDGFRMIANVEGGKVTLCRKCRRRASAANASHRCQLHVLLAPLLVLGSQSQPPTLVRFLAE
jgi:hypothetical protein